MRSALLITTALFASAMASHSHDHSSASASASISPEECAAECSSAHDACAAAPGANMAQCAADFAACLGYNPYETGFVQPTACSSSSSPPSSSAAAPTHTKAPSPQPHHDEGDECRCDDEYSRCRAAPGANMSSCASSYAGCLGYNPFDGSHDPEDVARKCGKQDEGHGGAAHRNETRPVQPTLPPVVSGGSGVRALDVFGLLAAGIAALL